MGHAPFVVDLVEGGVWSVSSRHEGRWGHAPLAVGVISVGHALLAVGVEVVYALWKLLHTMHSIGVEEDEACSVYSRCEGR